MSDTPRADAFEALVNRPTNWWDFARELERENAALRELLDKVQKSHFTLSKDNAALRVALQEIADASGFDNIGNWARNKAKDALRNEAQP